MSARTAFFVFSVLVSFVPASASRGQVGRHACAARDLRLSGRAVGRRLVAGAVLGPGPRAQFVGGHALYFGRTKVTESQFVVPRSAR